MEKLGTCKKGDCNILWKRSTEAITERIYSSANLSKTDWSCTIIIIFC